MAMSPEKSELLKKIQAILAKHNGNESEISLAHEYWKLVNDFRAMK